MPFMLQTGIHRIVGHKTASRHALIAILTPLLAAAMAFLDYAGATFRLIIIIYQLAGTFCMNFHAKKCERHHFASPSREMMTWALIAHGRRGEM